MAAPDIDLGTGDILVVNGESVLGVWSPDNTVAFGQVAAVYSGCDTVAVNDYIMYNPADQRMLIYGSTQYVLIKQESISGKENIIP